MTVIINGEARVVAEGSTISELLRGLGLSAKNVLIERNGEPVGRDTFAGQSILPDDRIEIINMVAGG